MAKTRIEPRTFLYPMPVTLVGAVVDGKPNFMTVAYAGIAQHSPPAVSVALGKLHLTNVGIHENHTFSVNIPSTDMVVVTDHVGLVSGRREDKEDLFDVFFGELGTAPMISECPLCLECRLIHSLTPFGEGSTNELFIGEVVGAYAEDRVMTDGLPDMVKIDPIVFAMHENRYFRVGEHIGQAWSIGKAYQP